ncbi:MAG TPA: hypothetical protein VFG55_05520 [Rhodanobacteraceae bacterium]|nr:hypothetical protein [Rhodanobacteraceae bacterium]
MTTVTTVAAHVPQRSPASGSPATAGRGPRASGPAPAGSTLALVGHFEAADDLDGLVADLSARADEGEAAAMTLIATSIEECMRLRGNPGYADDLRDIRDRQMQLRGTAPIPLEFIDRYRSRCRNLALDPNATPLRARRLREQAAKLGDPLALAGRVAEHGDTMTDEALKQALMTIVASGNPYALAALAPELAVTNRLGTYSGGVEDALAWQLVACDLGMDCSPTSFVVRQACLVGAHCAFADFRSLVQNFLAAPASFRRILFLEQEILAILRSGNLQALFAPEAP